MADQLTGGFVQACGPCYRCARFFVFSPTKVPSVVINGQREPLCATCVELLSQLRVRQGLEPIHVLPGAYGADSAEEFMNA